MHLNTYQSWVKFLGAKAKLEVPYECQGVWIFLKNGTWMPVI